LTLSIPVKVNHKSNVSDVCLNLQNKIFESISYMTDFKPEAIEIQVTGFIFSTRVTIPVLNGFVPSAI